MAGRSWTRNGRAGVFQISDERYVSVRRIKDSPTFMVEECYPCEGAPSGWYSSGTPSYVEAGTEQQAAQGFTELARASLVRENEEHDAEQQAIDERRRAEEEDWAASIKDDKFI